MGKLNQIDAEIIYHDTNHNNNHALIKILHFNDVYNIESGSVEPKAGAARFLTALEHLKNDPSFESTIVLFSGDAFSPSECKILSQNNFKNL